MESFHNLLLLICSIIFIFLGLHKLFHTCKSQTATRNTGNGKLELPPGRKGWPFLGETLDYISKIYKGVPEKFVGDRTKKYSSKIFKTSLIGQPMAFLCGAEGNKFLFSNENNLVQVWWPSSMDKLFWSSKNSSIQYKSATDKAMILRQLLWPFLKADAIKKYASIMDDTMKQILHTDFVNEQVKISPMAKKYASALSWKIFLGVDDVNIIEDFGKLIENVAVALPAIPINLPGTTYHRGIKASKIIRKKIEMMVKERRNIISENHSSSAKDAITHMLQTTDENGQFLSVFDIASELLTGIIGAYTTTNGTISSVMMFLAELPDIYNNVLREQMEIANSKEPKEPLRWEDLSKMKYTWNVVCEALRLIPPVTGTFRVAITDFEYAGYLIPKGWKIHWIAAATHKNPEYFQDPEKFDPSKFEGNGPAPYAFVPFGGGPRMCPGNEYARVAILVFIHNMVTKFRWEKQIPDEKIIYDPVPRPSHGLPVHLHPHNLPNNLWGEGSS